MTYHDVARRSGSDNWATPWWLVAELAAEFGPFDLDPAADEANAKAPEFYTREQNGLLLPWKGRCFLNPPYGRDIGLWLAKARTEVAVGRAELVVALVPVRTDTLWWRTHTPRAEVRYRPHRIKYVGNQSAPFASAVLVYGAGTPGKSDGE